jgi:phage terminase small subunit
MARPSRRSAASGNFDSIYESKNRIDSAVLGKIKKSREGMREQKIANLTAMFRFRDLKAVQQANAVKRAKNEGKLNERQRLFVTNYVVRGMSQKEAAKAAGYNGSRGSVQKLISYPKIEQAIKTEQKAFEQALQVSRQEVVEGLKEAIDMARVKADPLSMVAGWREVAKICGYYEPVKHKVEVSMNGQVLMHQITAMSDEDLLKLADQNNILDGEFTSLPKPE